MVGAMLNALMLGGIVAGWGFVFVVVLMLLNQWFTDRMSRDD